MTANLDPVPSLPPVPSGAVGDTLLLVARPLADASLAPAAFGVELGDDVGLHVKPLPAENPAHDLFGFHAPARWDAFGVTVTGVTLAYPGPVAGPLPSDHPVVVTLLVHRHGAMASVIRPEGLDPIEVVEHDTAGTCGAVTDICRRVLGLPTLPPDRSPAELWCARWLDRVATVASADPATPLTWDQVAALHPAVAHLTELDSTLADDPGRTLRSLGPAVAEAWTWADLRATYVDDRTDSHLRAAVVDWMDDGMFSRWALARTPEMTDLRAMVGELLPTATIERVDDILRSWGLPGQI